MKFTKSASVLLTSILLMACNSPQQLEEKNSAFQKRHYFGTNDAGNPIYKYQATGDIVPRRSNILLGHTEETVRKIPVDQLPKPDLKFPPRLFSGWCERDGFPKFVIKSVKHNGNFVVRVSSSGNQYYPSYTVTAECLK